MAKQNKFESQSGYFADTLYDEIEKNPDIFMLTGDVGYGVLDDIKRDFPHRFINVGAAEQTLLDIGVGLVMSGKIAVCYSITSFLLYRGFETIRDYIDHEKIPVILVGRGRDKDYENAGFTHWSEDDMPVMNLFPNIFTYSPETPEEASEAIKDALFHRDRPSYINLSKR
jgi:transketolase